MARVVCRVHRSDEQLRASFAWSEGPDEFPKYHTDGQLYRALERTVRQVREKLGHVVKDYVLETPDEIRRTTAFELAEAGYELFQQLFWPAPEDQPQADDVRQWLTDLRDRGEVESLELVVESPWSIPWNAVYDQPPDRAEFLQGDPPWEPFWGVRYRLGASRGGGSPLRRTAMLDRPQVLLVGDARDGELEEVVGDLQAFAAEHQLTFVTCLDDLKRELNKQRPDLLYWLSHAEPAALVLGGDEISADDLLKLLRRPRTFSGLAFLNCCGTAVDGGTGSFLDTLRNVGFSGLIGTEQITYSTDASRLGLCFLEAFLLRGEPAGEALRRLRQESAPIGLVYGTYCPPLLRVQPQSSPVSVRSEPAVLDRAAEPAVALGPDASIPLPDQPYRGLAYFERRDRALFKGRQDDAVRCADLLDRDHTRFLLLHGESGVGKSSFLRAGLIPYLEEERAGYRFLRSRRDEGDQESALFVRCTNDPFGQLADALSSFCGRPMTYRTPGGAEPEVNLPKVLGGVAGTSDARDLREALWEDPRLLGRVLAQLGRQLPFRLVTVIDQAEELYTLSRTEQDQQTRRRTLEMLRGALDVAGDFKLVLTLRTEYLGRLADALREELSDPRRISECLLSNLDTRAISAAILSPTQVKKWEFSYDPGVANAIASSAVALQADDGASILPLVQVLCKQLFDSVRVRTPRQVTMRDWEDSGGIRGSLERYVDECLQTISDQLKLTSADRRALCHFLEQLHVQRPDGTSATALVLEREANESWTADSDFSRVRDELVNQRLVRRDQLRIGGEAASYLSLGHDRLVEPLVSWLNRERKASRTGRAELRLSERSARWNAKPENQQLPSWWEYLSIVGLTSRYNWTEPQRHMMRRARWFYGVRTSLVLAVALALAVAGVTIRRDIVANFEQARAQALVNSLRNASITQVSQIVDQLRPLQKLTSALLSQQLATATDGSPQRLNLSLAQLQTDPGQVDYLYEQLLVASPEQFPIVRDFLAEHGDSLTARLWDVATDSTYDNREQLFRAACALATYDPQDPRWNEISSRVATDLVTVNPAFLGRWKDALEPVAERLIEPLILIYRDKQLDEVARSLATAVLSEYAADDVKTLAQLVSYADEKQFGVLFPVLLRHESEAVGQLNAVLEEKPVANWADSDLDASWSAVELDVKQAIESAHGVLNDRFALCQTMPLKQFSSVAESLRASGYRPVRFRPFAHETGVLVVAVWWRDVREWRLAYGLSNEVAIEQDAQRRSEGFTAVDVAGYVTDEGEGTADRYSVLWVKRDGDAGETRIYVGAPYRDHRTIYQRLDNAGFAFQECLQSFRDANGQQRYCGVKTKRIGDVSVSWNQTPATYGQKEYAGKILCDNDVSNASKTITTEQRYQQQLAAAESKLTAEAGDLPALLSRAVAHFYLGNDEAVLKDLDSYIEKLPLAASPYRYRAIVHARMGRSQEAKQDLASYLGRSQSPTMNAYVDAVVAAHLGEDAEGMQRLEKFTDDSPHHALSFYDAACAYSIASRIFLVKDRDKSDRYAARAVASLAEAVNLGYSSFSHIQTDPDFDPIKRHPGFSEITGSDQPDRRFATVWQASGEYEADGTHNLSPQESLAQFSILESAGYRPVAMSAASIGETGQTVSASVWHRPIVTEESKESFADRQANAAVALMRMGEFDTVRPLLSHSPDPRLKTWIIHRLGLLRTSVDAITQRLAAETDDSIRRALILSLGAYKPDEFTDQEQFAEVLLDWYENDPDAGVHACCGWLLKRWNRQRDLDAMAARLATREDLTERGWYVNRQGHTMIKFRGPVEFAMGSPGTEPHRRTTETLHRKRIDRDFALASTEVTVKQFHEFLGEVPSINHFYTRSSAPTDDCPQISVTWYEAAAYCRWLSEKEGIAADQMCYPEIREIREGMRLPANYLSRTGYRLPTAAEWEYACRAGALTSRCYGQTQALLGEYGWYSGNSPNRTRPVASLKPNDFGLFDMHGNVWEWCNEFFYRSYELPPRGAASRDFEDRLALHDKRSRALRGGSFSTRERGMRSAFRSYYAPAGRLNTNGFRLARTTP